MKTVASVPWTSNKVGMHTRPHPPSHLHLPSPTRHLSLAPSHPNLSGFSVFHITADGDGGTGIQAQEGRQTKQTHTGPSILSPFPSLDPHTPPTLVGCFVYHGKLREGERKACAPTPASHTPVHTHATTRVRPARAPTRTHKSPYPPPHPPQPPINRLAKSWLEVKLFQHARSSRRSAREGSDGRLGLALGPLGRLGDDALVLVELLFCFVMVLWVCWWWSGESDCRHFIGPNGAIPIHGRRRLGTPRLKPTEMNHRHRHRSTPTHPSAPQNGPGRACRGRRASPGGRA